MAGVQLRSEAQRELAAASILGTYVAVGTKLDNAAQIILFQNLTNATVQFSFDGLVDHFPLAAGTSFVLDICSDRVDFAGALYVSARTQIFVKQIGVPTTGSVYVTPMYSRG